jgi:pentatricopeptide repeat protein
MSQLLVLCLVGGDLEKAQEVMRYLIQCFAEVGLLKEAVHMVFEMRNQGLKLSVHTMNCALRMAVEMGDLGYAEKLFDEMSSGHVFPKTLVVWFCRDGRVEAIEKVLKTMNEIEMCFNCPCFLLRWSS